MYCKRFSFICVASTEGHLWYWHMSRMVFYTDKIYADKLHNKQKNFFCSNTLYDGVGFIKVTMKGCSLFIFSFLFKYFFIICSLFIFKNIFQLRNFMQLFLLTAENVCLKHTFTFFTLLRCENDFVWCLIVATIIFA